MEELDVSIDRSGGGSLGSLGFRLVGVRAPFRVDDVVAGSAAASSGLQQNDLLLAVDGVSVVSLMQAVQLIANSKTALTLRLKRKPAESQPGKDAAAPPAQVGAAQAGATSAGATSAAVATTAPLAPASPHLPAKASPVPPGSPILSSKPPGSPQLGSRSPQPIMKKIGSPLPLPKSRKPAVPPKPVLLGGGEAGKAEKDVDRAGGGAVRVSRPPTVQEPPQPQPEPPQPPQAPDPQPHPLRLEDAAPQQESSTDDVDPASSGEPAAKPAPNPAAATPFVRDAAWVSLCGVRHGELNQDRAITLTVPLPNDSTAQIAAVFDGHGLLGEIAAEVACQTLSSSAPTLPWAQFSASPVAFMQGLFQTLDGAVLDAHGRPPPNYTYTSGASTLNFTLHDNFDPDLGAMYICADNKKVPPRPIDFGCTAVVAVAYEKILAVANAGDAAAVFVQKDMPDCEDRDGFKSQLLTPKHTATEEAEQERISRDFPRAAVFTPDGYLAPTDPALSQYELQLTRSLGHKLLRPVGVVADPHIQVLNPLEEEHAFALVLCSDGVIDELKADDVADRLVNYNCTAAEAAATLCRDAQDYVMDRSKVDDTTAVVWLLGKEGFE